MVVGPADREETGFGMKPGDSPAKHPLNRKPENLGI
jgi:hypothetical protein